MKRNETASRASPLAKLIGIVVAAVLSGCAVTGPWSGDVLAEMPFNDLHYGP